MGTGEEAIEPLILLTVNAGLCSDFGLCGVGTLREVLHHSFMTQSPKPSVGSVSRARNLRVTTWLGGSIIF